MGRRETAILLSLLFTLTINAAGPVQGTHIHKSSGTRIGTDAFKDAKVQSDAFGAYTPYHNGNTLICSDCHVMHASEQHAWDGTTAPDFPRSNTPYNTLLRKADSIDVCISCHDGRLGVPDVIGNDTNSLSERSAGFFDLPETSNHKGHNLGRGLVVDPNQYCNRCHFAGTFATAKVTCIDCHNPHGNNHVRNLQWVSAPGSEPQFAMLMRAGATGLAKYERANVAYAYVAGQAREVTNMCIDCHHTFFGDSGGWYTNPDGDDHWNRHPNFNSEWGAVDPISGDSADPQHWTDGTGSGFGSTPRVPFVGIGATDFVSAMTVNPATNAVFCLSCHKAHGSDNSFSMTFNPQTVPKAKGCDQCHASQEP